MAVTNRRQQLARGLARLFEKMENEPANNYFYLILFKEGKDPRKLKHGGLKWLKLM